MPIRTSTVVTAGMLALASIGLSSVFGNTIVAMISPRGPAGARAGEAARDTTVLPANATSTSTTALPPAAGDRRPSVSRDGSSTAPAADGSP